MDALGRPDWPVSGGEVSRAYRKLSILVHPDKNPGEAARRAFEALNEAHRALKDRDKLVGGEAIAAAAGRVHERRGSRAGLSQGHALWNGRAQGCRAPTPSF